MRIICIGDSLTYGYGVPRRDTWINLTAQRTGLELTNEGICGDTTGGMLARFSGDVLEKKPDAVVLMGGFNDLITGCPNCVPQSNIMSMTHRALGAGIPVMVAIPVPCLWGHLRENWAAFADGNLRPDNTGAYRQWLLGFGRTFGVPLADFWPPFFELAESGSAETAYLDGIHPSREGHKLMAEIMTGALSRAGLKKGEPSV